MSTDNQDTPANYREIVKETGKIIDSVGITKCFYSTLFEENPAVKGYFNQSHQREGSQPAALAGSVCAYAANLDNLEALGSAVNRIAEKHVSLNVTPELYPVVGSYLLRAIKETHDVDQTVINSWGKAYSELADVFISIEEGKYSHNESLPGGWRGFKDWTVSKKVIESDEITSVYFTCDEEVPKYHPGNYITVNNPFIEDDVSVAPRNYSISDWSSEYIRISVKREVAPADNIPHGISSGWIHDELKEGDSVSISFPCGDFFVSEKEIEENDQIILLAGGVGITAILSMFKYLNAMDYQGSVNLIQSVKTRSSQSHKEEIEAITSAKENFNFNVLLTQESDCTPPESLGRLDETKWQDMITITDPEKTTTYICGPKEFIKTGAALSLLSGISKDKIHYEFFNTNLGEIFSE